MRGIISYKAGVTGLWSAPGALTFVGIISYKAGVTGNRKQLVCLWMRRYGRLAKADGGA
ncbi:MAG: hypothetical protein NC409_11590 [Clostridium sp.]|nr:hypothetical protein [Clostridium sp.]